MTKTEVLRIKSNNGNADKPITSTAEAMATTRMIMTHCDFPVFLPRVATCHKADFHKDNIITKSQTVHVNHF